MKRGQWERGGHFYPHNATKKNKNRIIGEGKETIAGMCLDSFLWPVARESLPNWKKHYGMVYHIYCVYYTLHPLRPETMKPPQKNPTFNRRKHTHGEAKNKTIPRLFLLESQLTDGELSAWFLGRWGSEAPEGRDSNPACETCLMFALPWWGLWGWLYSAAQSRVWVKPTSRSIIGVVFNGSGIGSSW